jgi:hypothetical protein
MISSIVLAGWVHSGSCVDGGWLTRAFLRCCSITEFASSRLARARAIDYAAGSQYGGSTLAVELMANKTKVTPQLLRFERLEIATYVQAWKFDSSSCRGFLMALHVRPSRCITVEDKVASFDGRVAGKAGVVHPLAGGFAVVKLSEPPAAGRGVFS